MHVKHINSLHMGSKYNSGTQYEPLGHKETDHYHINILFTIYHRCASMLCFGDFNHIHFVFPDLPENTTPPTPKYVCGCVHVRDVLIY